MLVPTLALFVAGVVALAGALIYWSNPSRVVNRAVFAGTLVMAAWLLCWHMTASLAAHGQTLLDPQQRRFYLGRAFYWSKWVYTAGALAPLNFWFVKECILAEPTQSALRWLSRGWLWILLTVGVAILPFTNVFIPRTSTAANPQYAWGFYTYYGVLLCMYGILFRDTFNRLKTLAGAARLELGVWLGGGCIMALTIYTLIALSAATGDPTYRKLTPLAMLLFYAGTAYAITTSRIFNARQILLVGGEKLALAVGVTSGSIVLYALFQILVPDMPETVALAGTIVLGLWFASKLSAWLNRIFKFYPQETAVRQAILAAARRDSKGESLRESFSTVLKGWGQTETALIFSGGKDGLRAGDSELSIDGVVVSGMRQLRWVTPERLARERPTPERKALSSFLLTHRLGVAVMEEGPALSVLVGVGVGASRRPFTYPQVTQLIELSSMIESALERAHFSAKVQHAEQLATVGLLGASLAHEIRNPLVSIKTFVQLLPTHHQDPAFREKFFRLIGDEVGRIDQLTEQLLDLASPRTYAAVLIELHPILQASLDLVAAKASHRNVQLLTELNASPDNAFTDASAAKQVMLNLCFNAIQAVESHDTEERWVKISTRNTTTGIEMAVADSGPGISEEMRPRLFQPFQTTKSTGFGLGLAICSDILANLNASISVDPPEPGRGATFRVTFPCQPSLS